MPCVTRPDPLAFGWPPDRGPDAKRRTGGFTRPLPARRAAPSLGRLSPRRPLRPGDTPAARDEPVILNPRTGRRRGTAEFLGRDEGTIRHPDQPLPQSRRLSGRLGRPRRCVWCSPRFACSEITPVLQPRTMKRADAATSVSPAYRPDKPGRMRNQGFSSLLNVRPLTVRAIDVCVRRWSLSQKDS